LILTVFIPKAYADEIFKITSVNLDTSNSIIALTVQDSQDAYVMEDYKLVALENPKRAYFDIESSVLTFPKQDWTFNSGALKQIKISQFSTNPNVVRVVMHLDDDFNTDSITFIRVKNNIIIKFKNDFCNNEYFQNTYRDEHSSSSDFYEYLTLSAPVMEQEGQETAPAKKELRLNTQYYMQNVTPKQDAVLINGFGALTIERPMILTNPSRIVYDLSNTLMNTKIRNTEYKINETDTVKIGQFSVNKARIVINTEKVNNYIPIFSADNQSLLIADYKKVNSASLAGSESNIISYKKAKIEQTSTMTLSFNEPVIHGTDRTKNQLIVYLYNVCNYNEETFKSTFAGTIFANANITALPNIGLKLTVPLEQDALVSTYLGADSKTFMIKVKEPRKTVIQAIIPPKSTASGKTVVIDAGHGGSDYGAIREGINEKDINLNIAKKVRDILSKQGYLVHMTRDTDVFVSLEDRVIFAEKFTPDIFISIHVNSSVRPEINGIETHYYHQESLSLAQTVHAALASAIQTTNRGLFKSKFYVINHTTMPAILVEIGFISNDAERAQLTGEGRKQATAKAIAEGVNNYFKQYK
jgi:N-acetylmuramoyl-L-alanine amidase